MDSLDSVIELKSDDTDTDTGANDLATVTAALDSLKSTVEERVGAIETKAGDVAKLTDRLAKIETRLNRPGAGGTEKKDADETAALETKAFTIFIRKGREALGADEIKSLRVADDTQGGYLAPAEFSREVDKNIVQFSPVRQAARVGTTSAKEVVIPRRTGKPIAQWVGETETRSATESAYGQVEIPINEIACYVDVSNQLLEDSAIDVAAEVAFDLAEEFGRLEGEAFIAGNGVKKPLGLMADPDIAFSPGGHATLLGIDGLLDLQYALAPFYRQRGVWLMNGKSIAACRKLQFAAGGYVWQPSIAAGQPETLLGRPIIEAVDMPDVGAGNFPVLFGDFASAFRIYDRVALSLLRNPYLLQDFGLTRFHARKRVGARVVRPEAVRKLKIATA